jgi:N-methylhydantoinase A
MTWRIGIDTGGTFTDVVAHQAGTGAWIEKKIWSHRGDPGASLQAALKVLGLPLQNIESVVYGTTVVTNTLIQGDLSRVALICTKGFRDVLHIARQRRDIVFGLKAQHRDTPIVPRELCFELDERCDVNGNIVTRVDPAQAKRLLDDIGDKADVISISFLHSYLNDENEKEIAALARHACQHVMTSHEASPEAREYERTLVTTLNAALLPMMSGFLKSLLQSGIPSKTLNLFHSAGGMVSPVTASRFPLLLAMSGPAAGVEAASAVARALGLPQAISLDMGGTTTDCSLIVDGRAEMQMDGHIGNHRVRQPMVAVESIGAGGGSIVRLSDNGLQVGPDSAGSDPGPACYNRGGKLSTITDAASILGYFGSGSALDRPLSIDREAAAQAYAPIADRLKLSAEETALGALRVANAIAARAIKRITMGRGVDARSCALLAFGGAGPMIACQLAGEIGIRSVIIPFRSSALSAVGCLTAKRSFTRQKTVRIKENDFDSETFGGLLANLEEHVLEELLGTVASPDQAVMTHSALMRYAGQSHEIEVPIPSRPTSAEFSRLFRKKHTEAYGYELNDPWECVAIRTTAVGRSDTSGDVGQGNTPAATPVSGGTAKAYFPKRGWCDVREFSRATCARGNVIPGPAIIVDEFSTILVPPEWNARGEDGGHIRIDYCGP